MTSRFVLNKVENSKRSGLGLYLKAIHKFHIKTTKEFKATQRDALYAQSKTAGRGELPIENVDHDSEWLAEVAIGTPPQIVHLDCDTGSSDSWVNSTLQPSVQQGKHGLFNPDKSSTFKSLPGSTWKIQYGDKSTAQGVVGTDVMNLGGIIIKDQAIELAQSASKMFITGKDDGLLGLAWGKINTVEPKRVNTVMENMIAQNLLEKPLFTVKLIRDGPGEFTFGFIDETMIEGPLIYTPVNTHRGFWEVPSTTAKINGKLFKRSATNATIIDTGTTLMLVDDKFLEALYAEIPGSKYDAEQGGYLIPTGSTGPTVEVAVGDSYFQVPGHAISFGPIGDGSDMDFGSFQSRGDLPFDIFGDVFLKYVLAVFDQGGTRFGCSRRPDVKYDSNADDGQHAHHHHHHHHHGHDNGDL